MLSNKLWRLLKHKGVLKVGNLKFCLIGCYGRQYSIGVLAIEKKVVNSLLPDTSETITSIASNQEDHALNQDSSTALMKSTQQTNVTHNDDRPMIFVNAINECLNYLKGENEKCWHSRLNISFYSVYDEF